MNVCPTHYGRANKLGKAPEMIERLKKSSISIKLAKNMKPDELVGKIIVGEYVDKKVDGYVRRYKEIQKRAAK